MSVGIQSRPVVRSPGASRRVRLGAVLRMVEEMQGQAFKQYEAIELACRNWRQDLQALGARWESWAQTIARDEAVPEEAEGAEAETLRLRHRQILDMVEALMPGSLDGLDMSPSIGAIEWHLEPLRARMESLQREGLVNRILSGVRRIRASDPDTLKPVTELAQTLEAVRHAETTSKRIIHRLDVLLTLMESLDLGREALRSLGAKVLEAGWSQELLHLALFDWDLLPEDADPPVVEGDDPPAPSGPVPVEIEPAEVPSEVPDLSGEPREGVLPDSFPESVGAGSDEIVHEESAGEPPTGEATLGDTAHPPEPRMAASEVSLADIDWGPALDSVFDIDFGLAANPAAPDQSGETADGFVTPSVPASGGVPEGDAPGFEEEVPAPGPSVEVVAQEPEQVHGATLKAPLLTAEDLLFPLSPSLVNSLADSPPSGITIWLGSPAGGLDILRDRLLEPSIPPVGTGVYGRGFRERLGELNMRTEPGRLVCTADSAWDRGWVEEAWKWKQRLPGHPVQVDFLANPGRVRTLLVPACLEWMEFHGIALRTLQPWSRKDLSRWWERQAGTLVRFEDLWRLTGGWSWALGDLVRRAQAAGVSLPAALDAILIEGVDLDARANLLGLSWPTRPAFSQAWGDEAEATRSGVLERAGDRPLPETELDWELWDRLGWMSSDAAGRALLNPWVEDLQGGWE